jgi:hypothetical protein
MSKQTAVQLLKESIDHELKLGTKMVVNWDMYLAMEKEQIEDAWDKRCSHGVVSQTWHIETKNGEQYYNETYKGGEQ